MPHACSESIWTTFWGVGRRSKPGQPRLSSPPPATQEMITDAGPSSPKLTIT